MDIQTARSLSALTTEFYRQASTSFSDTRRHAWPGWERLLAVSGLASLDSPRVLDLACGNLRFERYLAERGMRARVWAVDNCDDLALSAEGLASDVPRREDADTANFALRARELAGDDSRQRGAGCDDLALSAEGLASDVPRREDAGAINLALRANELAGDDSRQQGVGCNDLASRSKESMRSEARRQELGRSFFTTADGGPLAVAYQHLDVMECLYAESDLSPAIDAPACDLCVSFGFMHHIPLREHRMQVLRALVDHARSGGLVALSLWQFERDPRIAGKARPVSGGDRGDYLLGWQGTAGLQRFCHSFSEEEVDELSASVALDAREVARYSADGKSGDLNRYLVLERL